MKRTPSLHEENPPRPAAGSFNKRTVLPQRLISSIAAGILFTASAAWASPIDYTRVPDEMLHYGMIVTIVILVLQAAIGIVALVKLRRTRKKTGRGLPVWAVVSVILPVVAFWIVVFLHYTRR